MPQQLKEEEGEHKLQQLTYIKTECVPQKQSGKNWWTPFFSHYSVYCLHSVWCDKSTLSLQNIKLLCVLIQEGDLEVLKTLSSCHPNLSCLPQVPHACRAEVVESQMTHTGKRQELLQGNHGDLARSQPALFFSAPIRLKYHLFTSTYPPLKAVKRRGQQRLKGGVAKEGSSTA